jgi:AraC-like DNA-binding protein
MSGDPTSPAAHRAAMAAFGDALRPFLPVDDEGLLVNRIAEFVEGDREVTRVAQVCEHFGLHERALQRLVDRRLGLTPKWLIQRRRLQEAAEQLRSGPAGLGEVAALLGYADQAHFTRDFARVTAMTPGQFAARHRPGRERGEPAAGA